MDNRIIAERTRAVDELLAAVDAGVGVNDRFRRVFELYYRPLFEFFKNRGLSPEDCRDLTQETFLGIYSGIGSFRRQAGFETWLFKIATNAFRRWLRWRSAGKRAATEISLDDMEGSEDRKRPEPVAADPSPVEEILDKEQVRIVREAIVRLPDQMRRCLLLRVERGLKYREIALTLGLSVQTVKVHIHQARKRLKKELDLEEADLEEA